MDSLNNKNLNRWLTIQEVETQQMVMAMVLELKSR